jgi:flavorubredoxin
MYCTREISKDIYWVGGTDRRLALFENMFPLPHGVSYNSYLILDEKTALVDTVDSAITQQFLENVVHTLAGRTLDYLIVNHMEPDHCSNIEELARRYPNMKIVGNKKTFQMVRQFYNLESEDQFYEVAEHDELPLGSHCLQFHFAPMIHWPEVMLAYETSKHILFSADAFGAFGAYTGNLFQDEVDYGDIQLEEARRYYTNIVGKYGPQVQSALAKLSGVTINMICPLHGYVWRDNIPLLLDKYQHWSTYTPEKNGVVLIYASMYGNTENAVNSLATMLAERGVRDIKIYDISKTHASYIIAEAFRYSHLVFACPTYNGGLYFGMDALLREIQGLNLQNRKLALIGNGSWAPASGRIMQDFFANMKNMTLVAPPFELLSSMKDKQLPALEELAEHIIGSMHTDSQ